MMTTNLIALSVLALLVSMGLIVVYRQGKTTERSKNQESTIKKTKAIHKAYEEIDDAQEKRLLLEDYSNSKLSINERWLRFKRRSRIDTNS